MRLVLEVRALPERRYNSQVKKSTGPKGAGSTSFYYSELRSLSYGVQYGWAVLYSTSNIFPILAAMSVHIPIQYLL